MLDRVPIRIRLTAVFLIAMLTMIAAGGLVVRTTVTRSIDRSINAGLNSRVDDLTSTVRTSGADLTSIPPRTLISEETSFAQVLATDGTILASSERFAGEPLLTASDARTAGRRTLRRDLADGNEGQPIRILASPARVNGHTVVVLVGTALDVRAKTRKDLTLLLWIGGAVGALIASIAGYLLAALALRAVDKMRAAADQIDATSLGERIPVPKARDEMQRLSLTLNALLERVETAFAHERQFIARASHELRTPIAIIKTELELALASSTSPADLEAARARIQALEQRIESAEAETDRLGQLATTLLHAPRPTNGSHGGKLPTTKADVPLESILETVQHRFSERARRSGRTITYTATPRTLTGDTNAHVDRLRIEQAVANLVENSLQHGAGDITLELDRSDHQWHIVVNDHASGISHGHRPSDEAETLSSDTAAESTRRGLGLPLVKEIMQAHDGDLTFTSTGMPQLDLPRQENEPTVT